MFNRRHAKISVLGLIAVLAAALSITRGADAAIVTGEVGAPILAPYAQTEVVIEFLGSDAAHTGRLYFLGSGLDALTVSNAMADSDDAGLGLLLFNNHQSAVGAMVTFPEIITGGHVLHFAYDVIAPSHAAAERYRTDVAVDHVQFMYDAESGFFGVEDLRLPWSDEDYNDAMFRISYASVPGPGVLMAMGLAIGLMRRGRPGRAE